MRSSLASLLLLVALGVDQPTLQPMAVHVESLTYPVVARAAQIQGAVDVKISIDSQGKVSSAFATSGHPLLKKSAEKNIRTWRFDTSSSENRQLTVRYEFVLELPRTSYPPESRNLFDFPTRITVISSVPEPQP